MQAHDIDRGSGRTHRAIRAAMERPGLTFFVMPNHKFFGHALGIVGRIAGETGWKIKVDGQRRAVTTPETSSQVRFVALDDDAKRRIAGLVAAIDIDHGAYDRAAAGGIMADRWLDEWLAARSILQSRDRGQE